MNWIVHLDDFKPWSDSKEAGLYALYDAQWNLRYIGESSNLRSRRANHNVEHTWAKEYLMPGSVVDQRLVPEAILILSHCPPENKLVGLRITAPGWADRISITRLKVWRADEASRRARDKAVKRREK